MEEKSVDIRTLGLDPKRFKTQLINIVENMFKTDGQKFSTRALMPNGCTFKQNLFIEFFIATQGKAEESAQLAGYSTDSKSSFTSYVSKLMANEAVAKALMVRMKEIMASTSLTPETVISQLVRIATANVKDVTEWEGDSVTLKSSGEIDDSVADAISEISMTRAAGGHKSIKVKMHNKMDALKELSKLMQLYADSTIHVKNVTEDDNLSDQELIDKYEKELKKSGLLIES